MAQLSAYFLVEWNYPGLDGGMTIKGLYGAALRSRFVVGDATHALVDGVEVSCASLSVRSMNFGQHWRDPNVTRCHYSLELPVSFFEAFLAEPDALPELIQDARHHPDHDSALDQALRAARFPSAQDALRHPTLAQCLAEFFAHDALVSWLGDGPEVLPGFVLNSCDRIAFARSGILIEGECRPSGSSTAFQDL